jgi:hypothetical protein
VTFQVIDEGSWGSRGGVVSILQLLDSGAFTAERVRAIRDAIPAPRSSQPTGRANARPMINSA